MKKLLFLTLIFFSLTSFSVWSQTSKVILAWNEKCDPGITGYSVQFTTNKLSVPLTNIIPPHITDCGTNDPGSTNVYFGNYFSTNVVFVNGKTNTTCVVSNVIPGTVYYFTAKSIAGPFSSDPSYELSYLVPLIVTNSVPSRVTGFRIINVN